MEKLHWYGSGLGDFQLGAVLILTERTRQLDLLSREVRKKNPPVKILASTLESIAETTVLAADFIEVPSGKRGRIEDLLSESPQERRESFP